MTTNYCSIYMSTCLSKVPLNNWAIFYAQRCTAEAEELVSAFNKLSGPMGVKVGRPRFVPMKNDYTDTYVRSIHQLVTSEVCQTTTTSLIFFLQDENLFTHCVRTFCVFIQYRGKFTMSVEPLTWLCRIATQACLHEFPHQCQRSLLDKCALCPA